MKERKLSRFFDFPIGGFLNFPKWSPNGFADSIDEKVLRDAGKHNILDSRNRYEQERAFTMRGDREYLGGAYSNFAYIPAEQYAIRDIQSQRYYVNQRADSMNTPAGQKLMAQIYRQITNLYQDMASIQASYEEGM